MDQTHISEQIAHTTARIETFSPSNVSESGTGFFYHVPLGGESVVPLLITNRHMVVGKASIEISLTHANDKVIPNMATTRGIF